VKSRICSLFYFDIVLRLPVLLHTFSGNLDIPSAAFGITEQGQYLALGNLEQASACRFADTAEVTAECVLVERSGMCDQLCTRLAVVDDIRAAQIFADLLLTV